MTAWTQAKVDAFREGLYSFLNNATINSKEKGPIILGQNLYRSQHRFFDAVFEGLTRDVHDIKHSKSRQLGVSVASRAMTVFWCGLHEGLRGYMVFDTEAHKEEARLELLEMINGLPLDYKFPRIQKQNRYVIELENGTRINLAAAGTKVTKSTSTLGRSSGINFVHCSEVCSWGDPEAVEAFRAALAQDFENRLYIWESTAKGYNIWHDMWLEAKEDTDHQITLFTGWWGKDNQIIPKSHPDFERYGLQPPTEAEIAKIKKVREFYHWEITEEQLAWIRRTMNPGARAEGNAPVEYEGTSTRTQEQPWDEDEMFQMSASEFFASDKLTEQAKDFSSNKYQTWMFQPSQEFHEMRVLPARNTKSIELKVWEEPQPNSIYVIAGDPAFGHSDKSDRSAIEVVRCYADGMDQVAEYAWPLITTNHFAWVIAILAGWYAGSSSEVYVIVELNGPGDAVWTELKSLRHRLETSPLPKEQQEAGLRDFFKNVKNYFYWRSDALGPTRSQQWRTYLRTKIWILERLRDFISNSMFRVRSIALLEEMKKITRDGDKIEAEGRNKDDRVMAAAMAIRMWEDRVRKMMMIQGRTRDVELAKRNASPTDQAKMFSSFQIDELMNRRQTSRQVTTHRQQFRSWRYR